MAVMRRPFAPLPREAGISAELESIVCSLLLKQYHFDTISRQDWRERATLRQLCDSSYVQRARKAHAEKLAQAMADGGRDSMGSVGGRRGYSYNNNTYYNYNTQNTNNTNKRPRTGANSITVIIWILT
ncbi:hypothetical protein T492DRAFT_451616 [Pavlovales sp. CCMP2436]|nr:hypothetical protein T492DRAFT_451616 [Pavlovales sp. CCMP2436]